MILNEILNVLSIVLMKIIFQYLQKIVFSFIANTKSYFLIVKDPFNPFFFFFQYNLKPSIPFYLRY